MDKFLEVIGLVGMLAILLAMIVITGNSRGGSDTALVILAMLPWAIPAIIGCVLIAAFGNMLSQLKDVRNFSEKQTELLKEILEGRKI